MYSKRFLIKNSPIPPTSLYTLAGQTKNGWKMLSFSICNVNLLYCLNFGSTTINCSIYRWIKVVLCTHWYKLILSYTCHCMPQLKLHITWHVSWLSLHMDVWPLNRGNWHCLSWIIACIRHILNFCRKSQWILQITLNKIYIYRSLDTPAYGLSLPLHIFLQLARCRHLHTAGECSPISPPSQQILCKVFYI